MLKCIHIFFFCLCLISLTAEAVDVKLADESHFCRESDLGVNAAFVDGLIGTDGFGHCFPGATQPFGFVQPSPDTGANSWAYCSGYQYSDTRIVGFSQTHLNGTGSSDLGDVRSITLNGRSLDGFILRHADIMRGGELVFEMGERAK